MAKNVDISHPQFTIIPTMPDGRPAPSLLTSEEVLEYLRLKVRHPTQTLHRLHHKGLVPIRVGRTNTYRIEDVVKWVSRQR